jgi:ABC-type multidrug transport system fused ATPase/permease subunit
MKKQIRRVSPHQNGKVFGVLMAVSSLIFLLPMFVFMFASMPEVDSQGNPVDFPKYMFLIMPLIYLIFGYIFVAISSLIYNFLANYIGGVEFELEDKNT